MLLVISLGKLVMVVSVIDKDHGSRLKMLTVRNNLKILLLSFSPEKRGTLKWKDQRCSLKNVTKTPQVTHLAMAQA